MFGRRWHVWIGIPLTGILLGALVSASTSSLSGPGTQITSRIEEAPASLIPAATASCGNSNAAFSYFSKLLRRSADVLVGSLLEGVGKTDVIRQNSQKCMHKVTGSFRAWNLDSRLVTVSYQVALEFDSATGQYTMLEIFIDL